LGADCLEEKTGSQKEGDNIDGYWKPIAVYKAMHGWYTKKERHIGFG